MNWVQRKIYLYNVTFGLYMLDWWERCLFNTIVLVLMWFMCYNGIRFFSQLGSSGFKLGFGVTSLDMIDCLLSLDVFDIVILSYAWDLEGSDSLCEIEGCKQLDCASGIYGESTTRFAWTLKMLIVPKLLLVLVMSQF